jgi:class III poly(R)-hydroxyalkanoic acid synthase PhaE subunit
MTEKSNGSDWIGAWIEQQREQLRRAGTPGAQSTDQRGEQTTDKPGAEGVSGQMRDLGLRWLEAGQSYLQGWQQFAQQGSAGAPPLKFGEETLNAMQNAWAGATSAGEGASQQFADLIARLPAVGLAREHTEAWRELMAAQAESQRLQQELRGVWIKVQTDALSMVESLVRERKQAAGGAAVNDFRELYDLWVECGEKVFSQVAHSEAYCKLQAQVGNAAIRLRARQQAVMERGLKQLDLPTRSELNTVHKQVRDLRERVATLEAQLAAALVANGKEGQR